MEPCNVNISSEVFLSSSPRIHLASTKFTNQTYREGFKVHLININFNNTLSSMPKDSNYPSEITSSISTFCRSQWPRGLRRRFSAAHLLRLWVLIPPGAWMSVVSVVCCQVEVSATDWSLVQGSPTDCGASLCVIKKPQKKKPGG